MDTAPKGRHILLHVRVWAFDENEPGFYKAVGTTWIECWWNGKWEKWCGTPRLHSTTNVDPLEWAELP
jgi:hypothetical protein